MDSRCTCCDAVAGRLPDILRRKERYWVWIADFQAIIVAGARGCSFCKFIDQQVLSPWYGDLGEPQYSFNENTFDAVKHALTTGIPRSIHKTCKQQKRSQEHKIGPICSICTTEDWTTIGQDYYCGKCLQHQAASHASSTHFCKTCLRLAARYLATAIKAFGTGRSTVAFPGYKLQLRITFSGGPAHDPPGNLMIVLDVNMGSGNNNFIVEQISDMPFELQQRPFQDLDFGSNRAYSQVSGWLKACDEHGCYSTDQALPTRVIDVNPNGPVSGIRLLLSNGQPGKYAALSYCWSSAAQPTTIKANVRDREHHLQLDRLPGTIRDAITFCRRLGIPHLWVDSLCIIQDYEEDRAYELSNMCNIFANAYVTISASRAPNSQAGFLHTIPVESCEIDLKHLDTSLGPVRIRKKILHDIRDEPIYRRAWTLQERMLSKRVVSFGRSLTWSCEKTKELDPHTGDNWITEATDIGHLYPLSTHLKESSNLESVWRQIVELYTTMNLTFGSDKLPALAGVASAISSGQPGNIYLAGLWSASLSQHLMWWMDGVGRRPSQWRAPSWSWASLDTPVEYFPGEDEQTWIKYVAYDFEPRNAGSSFGEILRATLTVSGRLCTVRRFLYQHRGRLHEVMGSGALDSRETDGLWAESSFKEIKSYRLDTPEDRQSSVMTSSGEASSACNTLVVLHSAPTWLLPVKGHTEGLVLDQTADGMYRRIGWFLIEGLLEDSGLEWSDEIHVQLV